MAAVNVSAINQTAIDAGGLANKLGRGLKDGRVKVAIDKYIADGSEGANSTIKVCGLLPTGANILDIIVVNEALGAGVLFAVGDSNSAVRYMTGEDGNAVFRHDMALIGGSQYIIGTNSGDNQILITTGVATLTAGKIIKTIVLYSQD